jgi:hypothetical protein
MSETIVTINSDLDLTTLTTVGLITSDEIKSQIRKFYAGLVTKNVLWDLAAADLSAVSTQNIREIVFLTTKHSSSRPGGKTAILISRDLEYGIGRMFAVLKEVEKSQVLHETFRDMTAALDWLRK